MHFYKKKNKEFLIVIPARLKSGRLPSKPLKDINGLPMIIRTYNQCLKVTINNNILIATDSLKIAKVAKSYGANFLLTSPNCLTGTDRVFEVSKRISRKIYINVQGDEPLFNPRDISNLIKEGLKNKKEIITGYTKISQKNMFFDVNIPKVVFDEKNYLMYASRAPIPFNKKRKFNFAFRQVCAYSFPKKFLKVFGLRKKKTYIEKEEDIEYLRFLEMGIKVKCLRMSSKSIAVDTPHDLKRVKKYIKKFNK